MDYSQTSDEETYEDQVTDLPSEGLYILQEKTSNSSRSLQDFLSMPQISLGKKDDRTTVSNVKFGKNYDIKGDIAEEFFRLMEVCRLDGQIMHLTERQYSGTITHSGIMLDFDIYQPGSARQFNPGWLNRLNTLLANTLANVLHFDEKLEGHIYVIAKPAPVKLPDGGYKDGMHILIPDIHVRKPVKQHLIYEKILSSVGFTNLFKDWSISCTLKELFDIGSVRNPVYFYGSCKPSRDGKRPVAYELIYRCQFSVYDGEGAACTVMPVSEWLAEGYNYSYELSLAFSFDFLEGKKTYHKKRIYEHKPDFDSVLQVKMSTAAPATDKAEADDALTVLLASSIRAKSLKAVLELLDDSYVVEYDKWFKVLCAIAHTSPSYKEIAKWFSKRVPDAYDPAGFKRVWSNVCRQGSANPISEKSIYYWARLCSPEKFKEVRIRNQVEMATNYVIKNEGRLTHSYVADMLRDIAGEQFVTDVMKNDGRTKYTWYEFVLKLGNGNTEPAEVFKWRQEFKPQTLYLMIPNQVAEIFYEVDKRLENQRNNTNEPNLGKFFDQTRKELKRSISALGQVSTQNGIITLAEFRFRDRSFAENLDNYPMHLGVSNGIVSLGPEPQLIKSFHELKISKYTKVVYRPFCIDDPYIRQVLGSIYDIYLEDDVFMYKMFYYSTGCHGEAKDSKIMFCNGGGGNGKTTCAYMTRMVLGDEFSTDLKPGLLTSMAEQPQQANEAVMAMQGKRFCYFDEFNEHDALNMARVKSLVGPVRVSNRGNYGKMTPVENTATMEAISNYPFNVDTSDHGTWRRISQYTYKVKFTDNPDPNNPYERKNNRDVLKKWPKDQNYLSAWLSILVYFYQRLCIQYGGDINNVPCPTIVRETEIFRNKQDMVNCYISLYVVESPTADPISIETLMFKYREWFSNRTKRQPPSHDSLKTMFESSRIGKSIGYRGGADIVLEGHRIRTSLDEHLAPGEKSLSLAGENYQSNIHGREFNPAHFGMA